MLVETGINASKVNSIVFENRSKQDHSLKPKTLTPFSSMNFYPSLLTKFEVAWQK
jgi:hypothetical protein